jgi:hypothetical protein
MRLRSVWAGIVFALAVATVGVRCARACDYDECVRLCEDQDDPHAPHPSRLVAGLYVVMFNIAARPPR